MIFIEETRRVIHEMSNLELTELRQTSATIQCPSCVDSTPTNNAHTAQYSLFTSAERTSRAWLKGQHGSRIAYHLCAPEKSLSSGPHMSHPLLLSHLPSTTSTSTSSFTLPSTTTPEHALQSENTIFSKNAQCIINLSQNARSKSIAFKNHSGVKPCRVAETCAKHFPQVMSPKSLRPKSLRLYQGSRGQQIHTSYLMHRENLESEITEFRLRRSDGIWRIWRSAAKSNFQSHMHFDDSEESIADSDLEDGEL